MGESLGVIAVRATLALREDEPPLGLDHHEAICPRCLLAYWVPAGGKEAPFGWHVCPDCLAEPLLPV